MAIQLSDRDNLIFKFIEEHQVLLEKHIAWFISCDEKPVLIRDRLRKLFYLDYLLCERHGGKLPWWTTPTKPLVYMLSPLTRQITKSSESNEDLSSCEIQRHLLEVANLRMLFLMDQKDGTISEFNWTTIRKSDLSSCGLDAVVSFKRGGINQRVGIMNHPTQGAADIAAAVQKSISEHAIENVWVVCRDEAHQNAVQRGLAGTAAASRVAYTTHQDVYKAGIMKAKWQSQLQPMPAVADAIANVAWGGGLTPAQAF